MINQSYTIYPPSSYSPTHKCGPYGLHGCFSYSPFHAYNHNNNNSHKTHDKMCYMNYWLPLLSVHDIIFIGLVGIPLSTSQLLIIKSCLASTFATYVSADLLLLHFLGYSLTLTRGKLRPICPACE